MARSKHTRRKKNMNGGKLLLWLIAVVLVLILVFNFSGNIHPNNSDPTNSIASIGENDSTQAPQSSNTIESNSANLSSIVANSSGDTSSANSNVNVNDSNFALTLVNATNLLPTSYSPQVKIIASGDSQLNPYSLSFDIRAVDALDKLLNDAKADGCTLYVISAYRAMSKQISLYDAEVARQKQNHPEYSDEEAKAAAGKNVAIPGTSEHQLGLAVDFNTVETSFENTKEFSWLKENAEKYGFVNRYPKDKTEITGINYEPWHYRYVGVEHAKAMNAQGVCLEEYVK